MSAPPRLPREAVARGGGEEQGGRGRKEGRPQPDDGRQLEKLPCSCPALVALATRWALMNKSLGGPVEKVAMYGYKAIALRSDGKLVGWGDNSRRNLGILLIIPPPNQLSAIAL